MKIQREFQIFKSVSYLLLARDGDGGVDAVHALAETVVVHVDDSVVVDSPDVTVDVAVPV